jgi:hypothetical protein
MERLCKRSSHRCRQASAENGWVAENIVLSPLHGVQFAIHAKGKVERFFRTLQESFLPELSFQTATDLEQLNSLDRHT